MLQINRSIKEYLLLFAVNLYFEKIDDKTPRILNRFKLGELTTAILSELILSKTLAEL
nr:hypothetical protein [uncultured bacterium]